MSIYGRRPDKADGKPYFDGLLDVVPVSTDSLDLWDDQHLVVSDCRTWQIIERSDIGYGKQILPLLDDRAPFAIRRISGKIVACTEMGLWLVEIKPTAAKP